MRPTVLATTPARIGDYVIRCRAICRLPTLADRSPRVAASVRRDGRPTGRTVRLVVNRPFQKEKVSRFPSLWGFL